MDFLNFSTFKLLKFFNYPKCKFPTLLFSLINSENIMMVQEELRYNQEVPLIFIICIEGEKDLSPSETR